MLKKEIIYREFLIRWLSKKSLITQKSLSEACKVSIGTVNYALSALESMGAIAKKPMGFRVVDARKVLIYWANARKLKKDTIYTTGFQGNIRELENTMPSKAVFTAYSGYSLKYKDTPADYGEVYIYLDEAELEKFKKRFPKKAGRVALYVLKKDNHMDRCSRNGIAPDVQLYVDLWNIGTWNANEFLKALEVKIFGE